jgi:TorA maturation chaperone TorD
VSTICATSPLFSIRRTKPNEFVAGFHSKKRKARHRPSTQQKNIPTDKKVTILCADITNFLCGVSLDEHQESFISLFIRPCKKKFSASCRSKEEKFREARSLG